MIDNVLEQMQKAAAQYRRDNPVNIPEHDRKNDDVNQGVNEYKIVQGTLKLSQIIAPISVKCESMICEDDVTQCMDATIAYATCERQYAMVEFDYYNGVINCYDDPASEPVDIITVFHVEATRS